MRKIVVLSLFAAMFFVSSCGNKQKTRTEEVAAFRSELTAEDTTQMLRLCDDAMEQLKARNIDQVLASLQEYSDSTKEIKPQTEQTKCCLCCKNILILPKRLNR